MTDRPPTPPTPPSGPTIAECGPEDRTVATTPQLAASIADVLDLRLDDDTLETLLLELDRHGYVEWVTVTRSGDYVWDLSESADRIADAVAAAVADRIRSWLADDAGA